MLIVESTLTTSYPRPYGGRMTTAGLDGVVAAVTRLSHVDGERGELVIVGYDVEALAEHATFEETTWLLWHGALPSRRELDAFRAALASRRTLPPGTLALLAECARAGVAPMDALRMGVDTLSLAAPEAIDLVARAPAIVAAYWRLRRGEAPIAPRADLGHAASLLHLLTGVAPDDERARGLETYLNTVVDHGLNASTFAARVITSTGADLVSAVVGAIGALKGPLHGGAPGPALDLVFEIGDASRAEAVLRAKLEAGERLMGFGHRVYRVRDPRAEVLARAAERLYRGSAGAREAGRGDVGRASADPALHALAKVVEDTAIRLLDEYKPGRRLRTNVEFYTALLLHGLGLDVSLFTPIFAVSRLSGWIAHALEQRGGRLIRPQSEYAGPRGRAWVPLAERPDAVASR
jgi:citrate synthase